MQDVYKMNSLKQWLINITTSQTNLKENQNQVMKDIYSSKFMQLHYYLNELLRMLDSTTFNNPKFSTLINYGEELKNKIKNAVDNDLLLIRSREEVIKIKMAQIKYNIEFMRSLKNQNDPYLKSIKNIQQKTDKLVAQLLNYEDSAWNNFMANPVLYNKQENERDKLVSIFLSNVVVSRKRYLLFLKKLDYLFSVLDLFLYKTETQTMLLNSFKQLSTEFTVMENYLLTDLTNCDKNVENFLKSYLTTDVDINVAAFNSAGYEFEIQDEQCVSNIKIQVDSIYKVNNAKIISVDIIKNIYEDTNSDFYKNKNAVMDGSDTCTLMKNVSTDGAGYLSNQEKAYLAYIQININDDNDISKQYIQRNKSVKNNDIVTLTDYSTYILSQLEKKSRDKIYKDTDTIFIRMFVKFFTTILSCLKIQNFFDNEVVVDKEMAEFCNPSVFENEFFTILTQHPWYAAFSLETNKFARLYDDKTSKLNNVTFAYDKIDKFGFNQIPVVLDFNKVNKEQIFLFKTMYAKIKLYLDMFLLQIKPFKSLDDFKNEACSLYTTHRKIIGGDGLLLEGSNEIVKIELIDLYIKILLLLRYYSNITSLRFSDETKNNDNVSKYGIKYIFYDGNKYKRLYNLCTDMNLVNNYRNYISNIINEINNLHATYIKSGNTEDMTVSILLDMIYNFSKHIVFYKDDSQKNINSINNTVTCNNNITQLESNSFTKINNTVLINYYSEYKLNFDENLGILKDFVNRSFDNIFPDKTSSMCTNYENKITEYCQVLSNEIKNNLNKRYDILIKAMEDILVKNNPLYKNNNYPYITNNNSDLVRLPDPKRIFGFDLLNSYYTAAKVFKKHFHLKNLKITDILDTQPVLNIQREEIVHILLMVMGDYTTITTRNVINLFDICEVNPGFLYTAIYFANSGYCIKQYNIDIINRQMNSSTNAICENKKINMSDVLFMCNKIPSCIEYINISLNSWIKEAVAFLLSELGINLNNASPAAHFFNVFFNGCVQNQHSKGEIVDLSLLNLLYTVNNQTDETLIYLCDDNYRPYQQFYIHYGAFLLYVRDLYQKYKQKKRNEIVKQVCNKIDLIYDFFIKDWVILQFENREEYEKFVEDDKNKQMDKNTDNCAVHILNEDDELVFIQGDDRSLLSNINIYDLLNIKEIYKKNDLSNNLVDNIDNMLFLKNKGNTKVIRSNFVFSSVIKPLVSEIKEIYWGLIREQKLYPREKDVFERSSFDDIRAYRDFIIKVNCLQSLYTNKSLVNTIIPFIQNISNVWHMHTEFTKVQSIVNEMNSIAIAATPFFNNIYEKYNPTSFKQMNNKLIPLEEAQIYFNETLTYIKGFNKNLESDSLIFDDNMKTLYTFEHLNEFLNTELVLICFCLFCCGIDDLEKKIINNIYEVMAQLSSEVGMWKIPFSSKYHALCDHLLNIILSKKTGTSENTIKYEAMYSVTTSIKNKIELYYPRIQIYINKMVKRCNFIFSNIEKVLGSDGLKNNYMIIINKITDLIHSVIMSLNQNYLFMEQVKNRLSIESQQGSAYIYFSDIYDFLYKYDLPNEINRGMTPVIYRNTKNYDLVSNWPSIFEFNDNQKNNRELYFVNLDRFMELSLRFYDYLLLIPQKSELYNTNNIKNLETYYKSHNLTQIKLDSSPSIVGGGNFLLPSLILSLNTYPVNIQHFYKQFYFINNTKAMITYDEIAQKGIKTWVPRTGFRSELESQVLSRQICEFFGDVKTFDLLSIWK